MKKHTLICLLLSFTVFSFQASAQEKVPVRLFGQIRTESQLSYSFFAGPDAADFSTSINGFGSGILDIFGMRTSLDIINIGTDKFYLSLGAGFAVNKYRLTKNLVFSNPTQNSLSWMVDPDTSHNYVNSFFGYGKSKIITTSFYFPADINIAIGKSFLVTAGGFLDINLTARYKMKYLEGENKVKEIIRTPEFRNFNPSTAKFGVNFSIFNKKIGYGLSASYCLTPFFKSGMGPDIHEARISASYTMKNLRELIREKKK